MLELNTITSQVLQNCDISDSRHAGVYSVCGLALRLRDMYKWENGLDPWVEKDSSEILDWIGDREEKWDSLADEDFEEITVLGTPYDPFDTRAINAVIEPQGLLYGAGYAHSLKPTFFLAALEEKKKVDGHTIYVLGRELARDLFTTPARRNVYPTLFLAPGEGSHLLPPVYSARSTRFFGSEGILVGTEAYGMVCWYPRAAWTALDAAG